MRSLQQKLDSISTQLCCGDLLFDDNNPLSQVLVQMENPTCEAPIEAGYLNKADRTLILTDICFYCGALGAPDFLF